MFQRIFSHMPDIDETQLPLGLTIRILNEIFQVLCAEVGTTTNLHMTRIRLEKMRPDVPKPTIQLCLIQYCKDGYIEFIKNNVVIPPDETKPETFDEFRLTRLGQQQEGVGPYKPKKP